MLKQNRLSGDELKSVRYKQAKNKQAGLQNQHLKSIKKSAVYTGSERV